MYSNQPNCMAAPPPYYPWFSPPMPSNPGMFDLGTIREHIKQLKDWEKELKGKDEKKPDSKTPSASVISMMLLMLLLSPITGPSMYYFFQLSLGILHK